MTAIFPTPDIPTSDNKSLVGIFVGNDTPLLIGNVSGAISNLFDAFHFIQYGEMDAEQAAEYYRNLEMVSGNICEMVAECILTSDTVSNALKTFLANNYTNNVSTVNLTNPLTAEQSAGQLLPAGYVCDNSHLAGMAIWIRDQLHDASLELIQELEALTNPYEGLMTFIDNVEIVSWIGVPLEFFAWVQDNIVDTYNAAYTQVVADDIFCALYCEFESECKVSIDNIISAYVGIFTGMSLIPPVSDDFQDYIDWFVSIQSFPDMVVVSALHFVALQAIRFQSSFARIAGLRSLEQMIALGVDETSGDYTLCSCYVPPFSGQYDWITTNPTTITGATFTFIYGSWQNGAGLRPQWNAYSNNQWGLEYRLDLDTPMEIDTIVQTYAPIDNVGTGYRRMRLYNGATLVREIVASPSGPVSSYTWNETGTWALADRIELRYNANRPSAPWFETGLTIT